MSQVESLKLQGIITPEEGDAILQDPSLLANITGSPQAQGAQMQALSKLQEIVGADGLTAADKANLAEVNAEADARSRGSREALAMGARERGVGGSGVDLVSQMIADQAGAGQRNQAGLDVAKMAQERALQAIMKSGELGGQIQGQQFGEQAQKAAAQDAINRFNTATKQQVQSDTVSARNTAQASNLANRQRIADTNVGLANQKAAADAAAKQTQFENQMKIAAGKTGQLSGLATGARENAAQKDAFTGQLIGTGGNLIANTNFSGLSNMFKKKKPGEEETQTTGGGTGNIYA
jgi:hypothetical protein